MKPAQKAALANNPRMRAAWESREFERCSKDILYLATQWIGIETAEGDIIDFDPWPFQEDLLTEAWDDEIEIGLKARRMGYTLCWLIVMIHLILFKEDGRGARCLILCMTTEDARDILERMVAMIDRLPKFFLPKSFNRSKHVRTHRLYIPERGCHVRCLSSSPRSARGKAARFVLWDEAAFTADGLAAKTWSAVESVVQGSVPGKAGGVIRVVSSGNGVSGDGAHFAELCAMAQDPENPMRFRFNGWQDRPDYTREWYEKKKRKYPDPVELGREAPSVPEDALQSHPDDMAYHSSEIQAAVNLAASIGEPSAEAWAQGVQMGTDWGSIQGASIFAVPLETEGGGIYIIDELIQNAEEPLRFCQTLLDYTPAGAPEGWHYDSIGADAMPTGTNDTFELMLLNRSKVEPHRIPNKYTAYSFGTYKEGGNERRGVDTVGYQRYLLRNTIEAEVGEVRGPRIAIHPRCETLLKHMRDLQREKGGSRDGKIKKPTGKMTPDHAHDAALCILMPHAEQAWASDELA